MKKSQVALIGYTIRDYCKTVEDFADAMKRVKAIGYDAFQVSGVGPIDPADIARICGDNGLTICATHEPGASICDTPQAVVERLDALGCKYTAYPHPHVPIESADDVRKLAAQLDRAGAVLREAGKVLTYHNHAIEFKRFEGKTALEIIYAETDPQNLQAEIDTHWVQTGGGEPTAWVRSLAGRLPLLHMKDYVIGEDGLTKKITEVGHGSLDFASICQAADDGGCEWFIVEQDSDWLNDDPFASAEFSYNTIRDTLLG
jgi:sugar phosphate isomerase/epimerase